MRRWWYGVLAEFYYNKMREVEKKVPHIKGTKNGWLWAWPDYYRWRTKFDKLCDKLEVLYG